MQQDTLELILNSKAFSINSYFKRLSHVSKRIYHLLIQNKQYVVESNASDETFQDFIDYWVENKTPNIQPQNFYEFYQLSQEFELMNELIESKELEFGKSDQHLIILFDKHNPNTAKCEEIISQNLDFYLEQYPNEMMQVEIASLCNIFNHKKRKLIDHNLAFSFINNYSIQNNDPNIFILLPLLDSNKLQQEYVRESFLHKNEHFGFMPYNDFRYFENAFPINFLYAGPSPTLPGILYYLKQKQKNKFDQFFIASQSTRDIYNLINPNSDENFNTPNRKSNFIQFEFKNEIQINGIEIFSSNEFYPKSFDIFVNNEKVKSITNAKELNGENKKMLINFDEKSAKTVRLLFTSKNWANDNYTIGMKRVELLSPNNKYSKGVFAKLVGESENQDPHRCGVFISATEFDFNSFHLVDSKSRMLTYRSKPEFQVELTRGTVIIHAIRMSNYNIKSFRIIASDDGNKPLNSWYELLNVRGKPRKENRECDIYNLNHPSPPVRFIRVIQTEPTWDGNRRLIIYHFDIFGYYL